MVAKRLPPLPELDHQRAARLHRWNAAYRAWEPALAAIAVVVGFGALLHVVPWLAAVLRAFAGALS
ncbi:MAG: hypothetical protein KF822_09630 [Steroidobacteraceae bacterium]|nr:hypothetical protein [Steroidobacteraceae bacterium]